MFGALEAIYRPNSELRDLKLYLDCQFDNLLYSARYAHPVFTYRVDRVPSRKDLEDFGTLKGRIYAENSCFAVLSQFYNYLREIHWPF